MRPAIALALLSGLAGGACGQEPPPTLQAIAEEYLRLETYCDSGKHAERYDPAQPYEEEYAFKRCATRDGRFKYVDGNARIGDRAKWSDGVRYYRYLQYGARYQALPLDHSITFGLYKDRSQTFAVFVFEPFSRDPRAFRQPDERARHLASFAFSESTPQHWVFERSEPGLTLLGKRTTWRERIWVSKADRRIVRWAALEDGGEVRFTEVASRAEGRPLTQADLWYEAPLAARVSPGNNLPAFLAILFAATAILGLIFWTIVFAVAEARESILAWRRLLWKVQRWALAAAGVVLGALALLSLGGSGHPPAIFLVFALAAWVAIAFAVVACFTLASYAAQVLARKKV